MLATLRRAARASSEVVLTDAMLDIIWHVFDTDRMFIIIVGLCCVDVRTGNGKLDAKEFINVMRQAKTRSLDRPRDIGFTRAVESFWECLKGTDRSD